MNHGHVLGWRLCGYSTAEGEWRSKKNERSCAGVACDLPGRIAALLLPVGCTELLRIENGRLQLHVGLDIGVILGEDLGAVGINFHSCRNPGPRQRLIVNKADIV